VAWRSRSSGVCFEASSLWEIDFLNAMMGFPVP
jgi:hypothetical protein